jgi:hypothetical protein
MFLIGGNVKKLIVFALLLPALALAVYDLDTFDVNHWRTTFLNHGPWGYDPTIGTGFPGGSWPQPLHNYYVFGAGTWLGAVVGSSPPESLCTMMYNPNSGGSEACPTLCRYWREGTGDIRDRIYQHPGDWPPSHSRFPMAPLGALSDMDMWCAYCDSEPENHVPPGRPLGVDVYQTVYGFTDSLAQDFFFLKYEIANCSGDSLRRALFGPVLDVDIGDGTDDLADVILDHVFVVGQETIRVRNLVFAFDNNNMENPGATWESGTPGTVAIALLAAPDSLGLTAFKRFTIDFDPVADADQYLTLAGFDYRTGEYRPHDSTDNSPSDKRYVMATGPFDLAPDSIVTFWYAVIGSPFGTAGQWPSQRDTSDLALRYKWALELWPRLLPGIEETPVADVRKADGATIVRGTLYLQPAIYNLQSEIVLLNAAGRRVMNLNSGPNDVSALSPCVYFVRSAPGVVAKVVITH